jgi:dCTP deaminase
MSFTDTCMVPGTLGLDELRALVAAGGITCAGGIPDRQIQPASIDLTLDAEAYRLPGSVLPLAGETVRDLVRHLALERLDLSTATCLGRDQVYWVRLRERLSLPPGMEAYANSKSSTGRVDLATRVIADGSPRYDRIPAGYAGELWLELVPRSFNVVAEAGVSLTQAIFFCERRVLSHADLVARHARQPLLREAGGAAVAAKSCLFDGRVVMTADLSQPVVGFMAKRTHQPLVLTRLRGHSADDFFVPVARPPSGYLFLEKDRFFILATREGVVVPADVACEMVPYDAAAGEFRAHYAGFFDPGWGVFGAEERGAKAVLEVRAHQDDLILRHGQPICAMAFELLTRPCTRLYGSRGNSYANQDGPTLSKHFRPA